MISHLTGRRQPNLVSIRHDVLQGFSQAGQSKRLSHNERM